MANAVRLRVKVVPRASRDGIAGWVGEALKIRVTAVPERGKANVAVVQLLASALGVSPAQVRLIAGESREHKTVAVDGLSEIALRARLARVLHEPGARC